MRASPDEFLPQPKWQIFTKIIQGEWLNINMDTSGRVILIGQPRSVYNSDIECCLLEFWVQMVKCAWRSRSMAPIFNTSWKNPIFGANLVIVAQIHYKALCRQAKFSTILSLNGQNDLEDQKVNDPILNTSIPGCIFSPKLVIPVQICDESSCRQNRIPYNYESQWPKWSFLKVKVNDLYFQYQLRVSNDACLAPIWWSQLKSVTSYRADKVKFTEGRTDAGAMTKPIRFERSRGRH